MAADAMIVAASIVFLMALLDLLLSEKQKKSISDGLHVVWYWLAEIRKPSFVTWMRRARPRKILLAFCSLLPLLYLASAGYWLIFAPPPAPPPQVLTQQSVNAQADSPGAQYSRGSEQDSMDRPDRRLIKDKVQAAAFIIGVLAGGVVSVYMVARITRKTSLVHPLAFFSGMIVLLMAMFIAGGSFSYSFVVHVENPILVSVVPVLFLFFVPIMQMVFLMWFVAVVPMVVGLSLSAILLVAEFVVRRVIEYPKGPILAVSALFAAVGAVVKAWAS